MNYLDTFQSRFIGVMQWDDCNALFDTLISNPPMLFNRDTWERA
jgi:hypothetical protein